MATTCKLIAKNVLSDTTASVTFSSIPATYTDLVVVASLRTNSGDAFTGTQLTFNGSATGYSERLLYGTGSSASSTSRTGTYITWSCDANGGTSTSNTFSSVEIYIPNYAGSTNKSLSSVSIGENNATAANIYVNAALWSNTTAINEMKFLPSAGSYLSGSSFFLYGITKA